jgi:hypothetical protein
MTRREILINWGRLMLLRWRVVRGRSLPAFAMVWLRQLDRWAAERAVDRPWTPESSARLDRILAREDRDA